MHRAGQIGTLGGQCTGTYGTRVHGTLWRPYNSKCHKLSYSLVTFAKHSAKQLSQTIAIVW